MKTVLYFVRHGDKDELTKENALSEKGKIQAEKTGKFLSHYPIKYIVTSPALRTRQTTECINQYIGVPVFEDSRVRERAEWNTDDYERDEFTEIWKKVSYRRHWNPPIGESSFQTGRRMEEAVQSIIQKEFSHAVVVSHGGTISDFLRNILGQTLKRVKRYDGDILILCCSLTILEYDHEMKKFIVSSINSTAHL